uniref:Uncharacterized protein n=1 Tax=Candidatus Kentrum eta TaxID=2126337 RepID=A0A450UNS0_9GAMM|nr:MAG: hypothetical protein BECKH772A_GA0070896_1005414 [Candidatus Kentron sp. H]VFJ94159.1 MAG: hypothetical protein BECKH772B_GA0070898_100562 [Candidatus Kentron sp. H]VFK00776.1 MAG: hypothetical protein BECKH772C_GA0070978_1005214 [Candidatus Kentron sp. H]
MPVSLFLGKLRVCAHLRLFSFLPERKAMMLSQLALYSEHYELHLTS